MTDTATELSQVADELEGGSPVDVVAWAVNRFGGRLTFATGFGAEDCVIIDLAARAGLVLDMFTLDTGVLFPETYALWRRLEDRYGITVRAVRPAQTIDAQAATHGAALWSRAPDRCCELRKLGPLRTALSGYDAWVTAIRRDQTPDRATARVIEHDPRFDRIKINPLVAWTADEVWAHLRAHDVPYNPLHDHGYPSIGCAPCTSPIGPGEDPRAGRWRSTAKTECGLHGSGEGRP